MHYDNPPLFLGEDVIRDALGERTLSDLPDPQPQHEMRMQGATPLMERLWRIALDDCERNIVETEQGRYFGAGAQFGVTVYTRDISYAGILGLNRLYPELMKSSLEVTREVRLGLGLRVPGGYAVESIDADWIDEGMDERDFFEKHNTNCYTRRTDDVVWLWCAYDLFRRTADNYDWQWLYETGTRCFERLYDPFLDSQDGLYRGQASFVDIHFAEHRATGYPQDWSIADCVLCKTLSTNCLYVKGLEVMARVADLLGRHAHTRDWQERLDALKESIRRELLKPDGTLAYYKDRWGCLSERRGALGSAFAVLAGIVEGDEARAALADYPVTDAGVPLFHPFYSIDNYYHNNSSWPFVDTFFLAAQERAHGDDRTARNAALLARVVQADGFHEVVDMRDKSVKGSGHQLWSAAAFIDVCRRAGLAELD